MLQQADEQFRTFAVAANVTDFTRTTVQCSGLLVFFILPRLLVTPQLPVCTDLGIKVDIHFIFIKYRMLCAAFIQCFADCRHLFIFMRVTDAQCRRDSAPH